MNLREIEFPTNEHAFQAQKVLLAEAGTKEMFEEILYADTPGEAKRLGRRVPLDQEERQIWDNGAALLAMLDCNLAKFQQHYDCWVWLRETGQRPLVEHRPDPIWGDNLDGSGKNLQGKVLELVRALVVTRVWPFK